MEKQSYLSKIETPDYSNIIDEIYNGYVTFYHESGSSKKESNFNPEKIQALTSLMQIISGLENQIPQREQYCKTQINAINNELDRLIIGFTKGKYTFHPETVKSLDKEKQSKTEYLESVIEQLKERIEYLYLDIQNGNFHKYGGVDREIKNVKSLFLWLEHYVLEYTFSRGFIDLFNEGVKSNSNLFKMNYHINSLKNITGFITLNNYPDRIHPYNELSDTEKEQITKVGRPLSPDLPQSDVEDFVKNKLFPNGKMTDNKRFIHPTGKRKDLPNWNQLALKYFDENPDIELNTTFTKRQLIDRIKKAYEVINTSLN